MSRLMSRLWSWSTWVGVAWGTLLQPSYATASITDPTAFLNQTENQRTQNHPQFIRMLDQIRHDASLLSSRQQWHLRYLEAWETMFEGDYAKSEMQFHEIIDHSGDMDLIAKATGMLLSNLAVNRRYQEAFALSSRIVSDLPSIKDPLARFVLLMNLSQMLNLAGQTDLAIQYATMMESSIPPGESLCRPLSLQIAALYNDKRLSASSPELKRAIDICTSARQPVIANTMWLVLVSLYLDEDQPSKALALLNRIAPSLDLSQYSPHLLSAKVQKAQAYAKLGLDDQARKAALSAVAMLGPDDISEWLRDAYRVLYQIEKKKGNIVAAFSYYERYVTQDKGYLNDISARTLAYEMARQHTLVQKLETEGLSRQNSILKLQQALDTKAVETGRLYIALLLVVLASVIFWLFRLRRSQLRFKKLSRHDGLTAIYNHQHFVSEADHALQLLEKKAGAACLVSIDLDYFKQINDTHGHAVGDAVLRHTVALCRLQLRPGDLFGRLGGEEFGILLVGCARDQGKAIADRIRMAIESSPVNEDGCVVSFSASIGMASTDTSGYELQRLRREADAALYRAKRTGRNRVIADTQGDGLVGV